MTGWNPDVFIVDDELSEKFDTLESNNIVIVMLTCHAGGWIDGESDLCGSGRAVLVACGNAFAEPIAFAVRRAVRCIRTERRAGCH